MQKHVTNDGIIFLTGGTTAVMRLKINFLINFLAAASFQLLRANIGNYVFAVRADFLGNRLNLPAEGAADLQYFAVGADFLNQIINQFVMKSPRHY